MFLIMVRVDDPLVPRAIFGILNTLMFFPSGAIYPVRSAFATPDLMLWTESGEFIISVMIGGLGTLVGPVLGGAFFTVLRDKVSSYVDWYFIVIGLVLIAIVLFMPRGLFGLRRLLTLRPWRATASAAMVTSSALLAARCVLSILILSSSPVRTASAPRESAQLMTSA